MTVVSAQGEIDIVTAPELLAAARRARDTSGLRGLLIDLTEVEFIDSCGLAALFELRREFNASQYELAFRLAIGENNPVRRVLAVAGALPLLRPESP